MAFVGTENAYLRAWFRAQKSWSTPIALPGRQETGLTFGGSLTGSPRQIQLRDVGDRTIAGGQYAIHLLEQNQFSLSSRIPRQSGNAL